jgi:hypothetical protein
LKKSFVELCGTEKRHILLSCGADSHHFCQRKRTFASLKPQQFSFSTGWFVFCDKQQRFRKVGNVRAEYGPRTEIRVKIGQRENEQEQEKRFFCVLFGVTTFLPGKSLFTGRYL